MPSACPCLPWWREDGDEPFWVPGLSRSLNRRGRLRNPPARSCRKRPAGRWPRRAAGGRPATPTGPRASAIDPYLRWAGQPWGVAVRRRSTAKRQGSRLGTPNRSRDSRRRQGVTTLVRAEAAVGLPSGVADFADWVRPHLPAMARLAARLAPHADRDDVVQEALARAWAKRDRFDERRGSPSAWLLAITADQAAKARHRLPSIVRRVEATVLAVARRGRDRYRAGPAAARATSTDGDQLFLLRGPFGGRDGGGHGLCRGHDEVHTGRRQGAAAYAIGGG
jgi:hypothetical protein